MIKPKTLSLEEASPAVLENAEKTSPRPTKQKPLHSVNPNALSEPIIQIRRGVHIYKVNMSPFWKVRIRTSNGKYVVRSTKETSKIEARKAAEELSESVLRLAVAAPKHFSFGYFSDKFLEIAKNLSATGTRNPNYATDVIKTLQNPTYGLSKHFGKRDVRQIATQDYNSFIRKVMGQRPDLSKSTINIITSTFRNILGVALDNGAIPSVIQTPKPRDNRHQKPTTRPFFRFHPLVSKSEDQYKRLLNTLRKLASNRVVVRGIPVTLETYDLVVFLTNSFLRPTRSELYALKISDISIVDDGEKTSLKTLRLTVRKGKTGSRISTTMSNCVDVYQRILARREELTSSEDYLFFPEYKNRATAVRVAQRHFNHALKEMGLEKDPYTGEKHTMYSLRHTAICMRLVLSKGKVNIFTLARAAGTSVEQIENFYAKRLPLSDDLTKNLQSFGE